MVIFLNKCAIQQQAEQSNFFFWRRPNSQTLCTTKSSLVSPNIASTSWLIAVRI